MALDQKRYSTSVVVRIERTSHKKHGSYVTIYQIIVTSTQVSILISPPLDYISLREGKISKCKVI